LADFRAATLHAFADIIRHHDGIGVDDAAFLDGPKVAQMGVKGSAEQRGPDGVAHDAPLLGFELKIGFVRAEFHPLPSAAEFKRPCSGDDAGFELELTRQARPDGGDALHRFVANAFVGDQGSGKAAHRDGRFVHDVDHDEDNVLVIVVNLHADGHEMSVEGAGTCAVVVAHHASPVPTEGWLYFNGLPVCG